MSAKLSRITAGISAEDDAAKALKVHWASTSSFDRMRFAENDEQEIHTVWNLNAINGRTKSNQLVIFLPTNSGRITNREFPMLRTTISELPRKREQNIRQMDKNGNGIVCKWETDVGTRVGARCADYIIEHARSPLYRYIINVCIR